MASQYVTGNQVAPNDADPSQWHVPIATRQQNSRAFPIPVGAKSISESAITAKMQLNVVQMFEFIYPIS